MREIAAASEDLSRRTEQQAASLEQTSAALEEITESARKTSEAVKGAEASMRQTHDDAILSGEIVEKTRYHDEFLEAVAFEACTPEEQCALRGLLEEHVRLTDSVLAQGMLADWESAAKEFVLFRPKPQA